MWAEVDDALSRFCVAVCPLDQRGRLAGSPGLAERALRDELALPQRLGGLGIPNVADEARIRAAEQWSYRDASEAGMLDCHAAAAYRCPDGALDASQREAVGTDAYFARAATGLRGLATLADSRDLAKRRERNQLRSGPLPRCRGSRSSPSFTWSGMSCGALR